MGKAENVFGVQDFFVVGCFVLALVFGALYVSERFHKPREVIREVVNNTVQVVYVNVTQPAQVVETPQQNITVAYMTQISAQKLNAKDYPCASCGSFNGVRMVKVGDTCYRDVYVASEHANDSTVVELKTEWFRQCGAGNKQACWYYNHCLLCGGMNKDGTGQVWCAEYTP